MKLSQQVRTIVLVFLAVGWLSTSAKAQQAPFTILNMNTDTSARKLYVEVMYEKPACLDYQAKFVMNYKDGTSKALVIDSFLNNQGTYTGRVGDTLLMRPLAGGYKISFVLPNELTRTDSATVNVISEVMPYLCEGCGASGSNTYFTLTDIDPDCPYRGDDIIACRKRTGGAQNWEGWIQDPRDCKTYRIVNMPDGVWWFAQNLNYQQDLVYRTLNQGATSTTGNLEEYWCPNGESARLNSIVLASTNNTSTSTDAITPVSCANYGALYSWRTAMALNGRTNSFESSPTAVGARSIIQGICPDGWLLPGDYDWGVMLNSVEDCLDPTIGMTAPCDHVSVNTSAEYLGSPEAPARLKTTYSCRPHFSYVDSICATYSTPSWAWRRADYEGKLKTHYALGVDRYGFNMVPSGNRHYQGTNYSGFGRTASFWTSTMYDANYGYMREVDYGSNARRVPTQYKGYGLSVRCISANNIASFNITTLSDFSSNKNTLMMSATKLTLPSTTDWTYTWSIEPMDGKVVFANNGTTSSSNVQIVTAFSNDDIDNVYTVRVEAKSALTGHTLTDAKQVKVTGCSPINTSSVVVTPRYSSNQVLYNTVDGVSGGSGQYQFAISSSATEPHSWGAVNQGTGVAPAMPLANVKAGAPAITGQGYYLLIKSTSSNDCPVSLPLDATTTLMPAIPAAARTFCVGCGFMGNTQIDLWLTASTTSNNVNNAWQRGTALGNLTTLPASFPSNSVTIMDGRQNSEALNRHFTSGSLRNCMAQGTGWYVLSIAEIAASHKKLGWIWASNVLISTSRQSNQTYPAVAIGTGNTSWTPTYYLAGNNISVNLQVLPTWVYAVGAHGWNWNTATTGNGYNATLCGWRP